MRRYPSRRLESRIDACQKTRVCREVVRRCADKDAYAADGRGVVIVRDCGV